MRLQSWTEGSASCSLEGKTVLLNKFDITKHKQYRLLSDYDEKNAFDIEKYVKNLCKAKVRDNDTVDEGGGCGRD